MGFVAEGLGGKAWREAVGGEALEVGLVVVTRREDREPVAPCDVLDVVEVGGLVGGLPDGGAQGVGGPEGEVEGGDA